MDDNFKVDYALPDGKLCFMKHTTKKAIRNEKEHPRACCIHMPCSSICSTLMSGNAADAVIDVKVGEYQTSLMNILYLAGWCGTHGSNFLLNELLTNSELNIFIRSTLGWVDFF